MTLLSDEERAGLLEHVARAIVHARGAEYIASDAEWHKSVAHHYELVAKHPTYAEGRSLFTDAFREAEAALTAALPIIERCQKAKLEKLTRIGSMMSNILFNLEQDDRQAVRDRLRMKELQQEWDAVLADETAK